MKYKEYLFKHLFITTFILAVVLSLIKRKTLRKVGYTLFYAWVAKVHFLHLIGFTDRVPTTELVNKIYQFVCFYAGRSLFPYQEQFSKRIIRSVIENDGAEITALFSRQSGKTETVALTTGGLMIILPTLANMPMFANDTRLQMYKEGFWVGIFAPALRQAQINYNRMRGFLQNKTAKAVLEDPDFRLSFSTSNGQTVALSNGSKATAISASDGTNIEGESFHLIICEEAQDISNFKMLKSIHPMAAAYNGTLVKIGTATVFKASFYDSIQRNKREAKEKSTHIRNHFEYDCEVAAKYNPRYARYVESEKKRLGENSDEFQMSYKLKWIIERGMLIDPVKFEANNVEPLLETTEYDMLATHVAGIDVGGGNGGDSTVVTITEVDWSMPVISETRIDEDTGEEVTYLCYNTYIKAWMEIRNVPDYEEQYHLIREFLCHFRLARVVCDATREKSLSDRLNANMACEVVPYVFSPKAKSELYKHLEKEIASGRARVPGGERTLSEGYYSKFLQQTGDMQKGYRGSLLVVSHPPTKDAHDDYPDSWALSVWGCSYQGTTAEVESRDKKSVFGRKNQNEQNRKRNRITARRR